MHSTAMFFLIYNDITQADIENILVESDVKAYLRSVSNKYFEAPVYTSNFNKVTDKCKKY